jgi:hypothetical protein
MWKIGQQTQAKTKPEKFQLVIIQVQKEYELFVGVSFSFFILSIFE